MIFYCRHILLLGIFLSISIQAMGQKESYHLTGALVTEVQYVPMGNTEILVSDYSNNTVVRVLTDENDYDDRYLNVKLTYRFGNHLARRSNVDINSNNSLPSAK